MSISVLHRISSSIGLLALLSACGPPLPPEPPPLPPTEWGQACTAKKGEADLMGWDAGSRANLAVMRRQGVVAVRFSSEGCKEELELLPNCLGEGAYAFSPYAATESRVAHDALELGAKLPLMSVDVGAKLHAGRALRTDFDLAGVMTLPIGRPYARADLHGQGCDRATHVVNRVYLGGFSMMVGESRSIEAAATIFGASLGGSAVRDGEHLATEGDADACKSAQKSGAESPLCAVPLRLGLLPINEATGADYLRKTGVDEHGCQRGKQVWSGARCEDLKLHPDGEEIWNSLDLKKSP
ncbi:MAG: hypothetical protein ABJE95_13615 [Byssovorax sp.]